MIFGSAQGKMSGRNQMPVPLRASHLFPGPTAIPLGDWQLKGIPDFKEVRRTQGRMARRSSRRRNAGDRA